MPRLLTLLLFATAIAGAADLELVEPQPLVVDQNGAATANLTLRNTTAADIPLNKLVLTDFQHKAGDRTYPLGTVVNWSPNPDKVPANGSVILKLTVSKIWEVGVSTATLRNGDQAIALIDPTSGQVKRADAVLRAVRVPPTYNVQILSTTPDTPEIHFVGNRALVGLKNLDPFNYHFHWKLRAGEQHADGQDFDLPAGSIRYIELAPQKSSTGFPSAGLLTAGTLKDEIAKGSLILEPDFGPDYGQPLPVKDLAAVLRFSFWGDNLQQCINALCVFVLLVVGGSFSILVNFGIPNTRRALVLGRRTRELEQKIKGLGSSIDSHWRVLLEAHLPAIKQTLDAGIWILPSFSTTLDQLTATIDMGQEWVDITYGASLILHQAAQTPELFPPYVLQCIQERCARALGSMESGFTKPEEIESMKSDLKTAQQYLALTIAKAPNPDLEKEIIEREARVAALFDDLSARYPRFGGSILLAKSVTAQKLVPANYVCRDTLSLKMELLRAYDERVQQVPALAANVAVVGGGSAAPVSTASSRLEMHGDRLMDYLAADTHESLRLARLFVNEMRQDIYADVEGSLMAALKTSPPALSIVHDPTEIQVNAPVRFALLFDRPILNEAVARQEWRCTWDFGDGSPIESGWEVFHTFRQPGEPTIKVSLQDLLANPIAPAPPPKKVTVDAPQSKVPWFSPENNVEVLRLTIVLVLALFGLMTTASQQARDLSFFEAVCAVVALGFGADTLKNLVLRSSTN